MSLCLRPVRQTGSTDFLGPLNVLKTLNVLEILDVLEALKALKVLEAPGNPLSLMPAEGPGSFPLQSHRPRRTIIVQTRLPALFKDQANGKKSPQASSVSEAHCSSRRHYSVSVLRTAHYGQPGQHRMRHKPLLFLLEKNSGK